MEIIIALESTFSEGPVKKKTKKLQKNKCSSFALEVQQPRETMSKNIEKLDRVSQENKKAIQDHIPEVQNLRDDFETIYLSFS